MLFKESKIPLKYGSIKKIGSFYGGAELQPVSPPIQRGS